MVYANHIYANVTASDDSQANVYAVVLSNVHANTYSDAEIIDYITSRFGTIDPNANGVYRLTQDGAADGAGIPPGKDLRTDVEMNLFTRSSNLATGSAALLDIATDYNVCLLAIDEFNNRSGLERSVTGNIVERYAPTQDSFSNLVNVHPTIGGDLSNVAVDLTMSSDVYFEYYAALFQTEPTPTDIENFLSTHPSDAHVVYGNVITGFDELLSPASLTDTPVFTRAYQSTASITDYDFAADTTRTRYVGVFMKNTDSRGQHVATRVVVNSIPATVTPLNYTLSLVTTDVFDRSANVSFNMTNIENTVIYYKTFNAPQTDVDTTGAFKDDLFLTGTTFSPVTTSDVLRVS